MPDDSFVTMFYAVYNARTRELTFTQAGHPDAAIIRQSSGEVVSIGTGGTLVGIFSPDEVTFTEQSITLQPGDKVLLFTDAILDAFDAATEKDPSTNLEAFLTERRADRINLIIESLYLKGLSINNLDSYSDDATILGFEVIA